MKNEAKEILDMAKSILKGYIEDPEFVELQGEHAAKLMESYLKHGFSREEAIKLICSALKSIS